MKQTNFFQAAAMGAALALSTLAFTASAQAPADPAGMSHAAPADAGASASTQAFQAGSEQMMKDMNAPYTGNADKDFVAHMIPHHRGAVSMAQVELKYGKDPEMRKLAQGIIKAQKQEIAFMKKWQARHGVK